MPTIIELAVKNKNVKLLFMQHWLAFFI